MLPERNDNEQNTLDTAVERSREHSIQSRADGGKDSTITMLIWRTATASYFVNPWWSRQRDIDLRNFWKKVDHLAGAIYTMVSKMTAIPFRIVPDDPSDRQQLMQAQTAQRTLMKSAEFGRGWQHFYSKFIEDLITTDNGAFAEVIGMGDVDGPIRGAPISVAHLDSARCIRTGDEEFPVLYEDTGGKKYKLHYTRVVFASQMPSPIADMYEVGFCAVSRCINIAQNLLDILVYKQEKLGSRPHREILITKGGLDPEDLRQAFFAAQQQMDSQGLSRYSKTVVAGSASITEAAVEKVELSTLPDGFDEETSIVLGMAAVALAFGVDARELFPAMSAGATRADALLQHLKQRGKGPGQIIATVEQAFDHKFLPPHLSLVFDMQDDAEDRQVAEIRHTRSTTREADILDGVVNVRVARELMLTQGEIDKAQFDRMELEDGRLPDGTDVMALFYVEAQPFTDLLDLGVENPTDTTAHSSEQILSLIAKQRAEAQKMFAVQADHGERLDVTYAIAALDALKRLYEENEQDNIQSNRRVNRNDPRLRRENLMRPNPDSDLDTDDDLRPHPDDSRVMKEMGRRFNVALDRFNKAMDGLDD